VGQRIDKPFDDRLVDLCRLSHRDQPNLFPVASAASRIILCILWNTGFSGCARIAMTLSWIPEASCLIPSRPLETSLSEARPGAFDGLRKHSLHDDEFTDQVDQTVHAVEVHPDRRGRSRSR
jgi:hypothetical protein